MLLFDFHFIAFVVMQNKRLFPFTQFIFQSDFLDRNSLTVNSLSSEDKMTYLSLCTIESPGSLDRCFVLV